MKRKEIINMVLSGLFIAIGIILPMFTGQIPQIGRMLLPMHIPVLLCGILCGWRYGGLVGLVLPGLRFLLFGMPPLFPTGLAMTFELAAYGSVIGILYKSMPKKLLSFYISLVIAMISGRLIWGLTMAIIAGLSTANFTWQVFLGGAIVNALPGIILQLILIPLIMIALNKANILKEVTA